SASAAIRRKSCACSTPCRPTSSAPATGRRARKSSSRLPEPDWKSAVASATADGRPISKEFAMSLESLKNRLPDYARDLKLDLGSLATEPGLTDQQRAGTFIATALAGRQPDVIRDIVAEFGPKLSEEALTAAKAAAAIMGMNNIYYRFVHMMAHEPNANYKALPAKLRMNVIGKPGVDKVDFELWSLAVSAVNG